MSHKGSQETYDFISQFITPDFFFSKTDVWHRMGILGVFGDYVLSCTQGDIAEVGCGESSIYLSHLARKWGRMIGHCDIAPDKIINPLTVDGYMLPKALPVLEAKQQTIYKDNAVFFMGPSDEFFERICSEKLALVFIDGDHNYAQAKKDFENAMRWTVENGYIFLHDTYPPSEEYLCPHSKCGDVYRLRQEIERDPRVDTITLPQGTAMGVGITICRKKPAKLEYYHE